MLRRQFHALCRHQVKERIVGLGQVLVHRRHHLADRMRAGHFQHLGMHALDDIVAVDILLRPQAAGDNHLAVFVERLANRIQRFLHGGIDEAACIDDHKIRTVIRLGGFITFGA
jgi:hypothetical protein